MRKLEIKPWFDEDQQKEVMAIYIDDEVFDWGLVDNGLQQAREFIDKNPHMLASVYADIQNHFVASFSEFMGRPVSVQELNEAIKTGTIE